MSAFRDLQEAQQAIQLAQTTLVQRLVGRSEGSARCLFTNAFPELGDLAQNVHQLAAVISGVNDVYGKACSQLNEQVEAVLARLAEGGEASTAGLARQCEGLRAEYDAKLAELLRSRRRTLPEQERAIMMCRHDYELARFDLVSKVNENDRNKKLVVTQVLCRTFNMFRSLFQEASDLTELRAPFFRKIEVIQVCCHGRAMQCCAHICADVRRWARRRAQ